MSDKQNKMPEVVYCMIDNSSSYGTLTEWSEDSFVADGHDVTEAPYLRNDYGEDGVVVSKDKLAGLIMAEEMPGLAVVQQSAIDSKDATIATLTAEHRKLIEAVMLWEKTKWTQDLGAAGRAAGDLIALAAQQLKEQQDDE